MIFANIEYLFLLILLIPYVVWYFMRRKKQNQRFKSLQLACI